MSRRLRGALGRTPAGRSLAALVLAALVLPSCTRCEDSGKQPAKPVNVSALPGLAPEPVKTAPTAEAPAATAPARPAGEKKPAKKKSRPRRPKAAAAKARTTKAKARPAGAALQPIQPAAAVQAPAPTRAEPPAKPAKKGKRAVGKQQSSPSE